MSHEAKSRSAKAGQLSHTPTAPVFRELTDSECEKVLSRNHVARIAFSFRNHVDIEPVHYVYDRGRMFGRTSPGSKLTTLAHSHWIAAEVDEIDAIFDWRSVVVHGAFYPLDPEVPGAEGDAWARGVELLRTLIPETGKASDPVPFRSIIFQVQVEGTTGREATSGNR